MAARVVGIVLAGGASRRFGEDKCFADWEGVPFLARVAAALRPHVAELVVCARHGADAAPYATLVAGARVIVDAKPDAGPVEALRGALAGIAAEWVVVAGCDSPGLDAATVGALLAQATREGRAVLASDEERLHSVFAARADDAKRIAVTATRLGDFTAGAPTLRSAKRGLNVNVKPPSGT